MRALQKVFMRPKTPSRRLLLFILGGVKREVGSGGSRCTAQSGGQLGLNGCNLASMGDHTDDRNGSGKSGG